MTGGMPMADRISTLPDPILCHILSFLPTKLAVATSVLSKRWKPLWLSVPILDFDDKSYVENQKTYFGFLHLVYTVMLLRDKTPPIKSFRLKCVSSYCDHVTVNTWVKAAIQRKVEHLSLSLRYNINLPSSILTCKTLVVLKLTSLSVNATSSADFPSLKTLHLTRVHFLESGHLLEILSKCPVLEVLLIKSVKVTSFYSGVHLKTLPRLVKADISNSPIYIPWTGFYNAEFIRTKVGYSNAIYDEIPTFINLTYMELTFMLCYWDCLMKLLPFCPKLQVLVIDKMDPFVKQRNDKNWVYPQYVPECLLSQLKICSARNYEGLEGELRFATYIMQNARVLRAINICSSRSSDPQAKLQMIKKLSLCPRSSVTCELAFE